MHFHTIILLAGLLPSAFAHYGFDKLIINGAETGSNQYIRQTTRPKRYNPIKWENVRDNSTPDLEDIRCNQGSFTNAGKTQVASIAAGTKVGFKLSFGATIEHPGPALAYISRAPGDNVKTYKGDEGWAKIFQTGVCYPNLDFTTNAWCAWDQNKIEFNIPKDTPNGEYLLRVEHIGVHGAHVGQAEFYVACAQIKVTDGGSGTPGPLVKFPGEYKRTDPAFDGYSIYGGVKPFPFPGPAVWSGNTTTPQATSAASATFRTATTQAPIVVATSLVPTTIKTSLIRPSTIQTIIQPATSQRSTIRTTKTRIRTRRVSTTTHAVSTSKSVATTKAAATAPAAGPWRCGGSN